MACLISKKWKYLDESVVILLFIWSIPWWKSRCFFKDEDKVARVVNECDFNKLSYLENKKGFDENDDWLDDTKKKLFKINKKQKKFFRKGKEKSWKNVLPENLTKQIENNFSKEMKKLNYI